MGTGQVGQAIGTKLLRLGHEVVMGSRQPADRQLALHVATYVEAASEADWIVNALPGEKAIDILSKCDTDGKIIIDIGNYDHAVDQPIVVPLGQALPGKAGMRLVRNIGAAWSRSRRGRFLG